MDAWIDVNKCRASIPAFLGLNETSQNLPVSGGRALDFIP